MSTANDDFPILNNVIHSGDEDIIRATRAKSANDDKPDNVNTKPQSLETPTPLPFASDDNENILTAQLTEMQARLDSVRTMNTSTFTTPDNPLALPPHLESLIDNVINKHMTALRNELQTALTDGEKRA